MRFIYKTSGEALDKYFNVDYECMIYDTSIDDEDEQMFCGCWKVKDAETIVRALNRFYENGEGKSE